ncbi:MAG TPA: hypothetical protein VMV45_05550, partial [Casimicrobiaceae bacterium]|nr:hypothetical protein [Casimicrobiaceae bacterium]
PVRKPAKRGVPRARPKAGKTSPSPGKMATPAPAHEGFPREAVPRKWLLPTLESGYAQLLPRGRAGATRAAAEGPHMTRSALRPGHEASPLASVGQDLWLTRLAEYKQRKVAALRTRAAALPPGAGVPGQKNWAFLGPSVVMDGQAYGDPPVGGRVGGIAVATGGQRVYAASANGGVFRSDDAGVTWHSLMDAFDLDPTDFASTSLACGAIAIDPDHPDRIYVGTGEGDTYAIFSSRITGALPAYRGIGPIRSDDGGATWKTEKTDAGSPTLAGKAFFALAVDPADVETVVAATTEGLYRRSMVGGQPQWRQTRAGVHSSVVAVTDAGGTRFIAAQWGSGVVQSTDGVAWSALGSDFPTTRVGRIALGVQRNNAKLVYAFIADDNGTLTGVYRLDLPQAQWKKITNAPDVLPVYQGSSQGDYDLAIAVDPNDASLVYVGGSYYSDNNYWPASIWRCKVQASGSGYRMTGKSIGTHAHADVHVLTHTPGNSNALWAGCDGGVFLNRAPRTTGVFHSCNNGLACLCTNFFAQHPTDPGILVCGLQDNGTARTSGNGVWKDVNGGDGGYCLINWNDPQQVLVFANGTIFRATDGGMSHNSWTEKNFPWAMMTEPIVGAPYDPGAPSSGSVAAVGTGRDVHLSTDFGVTWATTITLDNSTHGSIFAMAFASATRFYVGTTDGEVVRIARSGANWTQTRLDNVAAGPLGLQGIIADIGIDWADANGNSVYVAFGGIGDYRHVWHFDGTRWQARSGPANGNARLLDVEHNALVVDRASPDNVYVGADIGVWRSPDRGATWEPLPYGLPDAPVFDLQIHATQRLLRCARPRMDAACTNTRCDRRARRACSLLRIRDAASAIIQPTSLSASD